MKIELEIKTNKSRKKIVRKVFKPFKAFLAILDNIFSSKQLITITTIIVLTGLASATMTLTGENTITGLEELEPLSDEISIDSDIVDVNNLEADEIDGTSVDDLGSQDLQEVLEEQNEAVDEDIVMNSQTIYMQTEAADGFEIKGDNSRIRMDEGEITNIGQLTGDSDDEITIGDDLEFEDSVGIANCGPGETIDGDGDCVETGEDFDDGIDLDGEDIDNVNQITGQDDKVEMTDGINLNQQNIDEVNCIGDEC